ncbi:PepSY-associated TM helix domain-containing protein [Caenispirillum bisanense]|uniref:Uncharacterized iron-regulated membrane protein n=1 Tax=Caenispirillum bisanense TaxID=414052 RepID=A0A286GK88_9PROT|nr:PepSY-associated TM helix domain-containing protein [Caenispirillum bisanense]SOD95953.1 Uncharacterized iron-regulated membrane protein [Caenispirillum bisanense]
MRSVLVVLHRYVGLAMALFLAAAGLTGSILAFHHEIDEVLNPQFYEAPGQGTPLGLAALADRAAADHPSLSIIYVESEHEPGHAALAVGQPKPDPATGAIPEVAYDWVYLDPVTGDTLATRKWGECCLEAENLIPFVYEFHHTLMLPEVTGLVFMGVIAILWTLDCFTGVALTLPPGRPFFVRWKTAWRIKRGAGAYRLNVDLHRAASLWLWLLLLPIAVSSIAMNLPDQVFRPVVNLFSPVAPTVWHERGQQPPGSLGEVRLDYAEIEARAAEEASRRGLTHPVQAIFLARELNYYAAGIGDHHDLALGSPWLYFDGTDGRLIRADVPGEGTAGEVFMQLQTPIHGGRIAGLPGRIAVAVLGLVITGLSVTGVVIWWKKRRARVDRARRAAVRGGATARPAEHRAGG